MSRLLLLLCAVLISAASVTAQTATQDVTVVIEEINEISVSGDVTLTIAAAVAGQAPTAVTNAASTYSVTTNNTGKKVTGVLDLAYAAGITVSVALAPPTGGSSTGTTVLSTSAADLVTGVASVSETALGITYTAAATAAAAINGVGETRTVTFTVTDV